MWHYCNEIIGTNRIESEKKNEKRCRCPVVIATAIEYGHPTASR